MIDEPYYKYLEWYLHKLIRQYNNGDKSLYNDIMQVCKEYNSDSKITYQNRGETYYPFIEIVHRVRRDSSEHMNAIKNWSCL